MQERMGQSEVSLDQPTGVDDDGRLSDVLPDTGASPEEAVSDAEWRAFARDKVEQFASTLKDKELQIFQSRLLAEQPLTLQEIGERFGISRERVRQIETRLKRKLKDFIVSSCRYRSNHRRLNVAGATAGKGRRAICVSKSCDGRGRPATTRACRSF